jgi:type II secretory pathway pseudopilin PulG
LSLGLFVSVRAFTLIEMLTTVAVLIIVLGLMVRLAADVRERSADQLTRQLLRQLDSLMLQYLDDNRGQTPSVDPLLGVEMSANEWDEAEASALAEAARRNNEQVVRALKREYRLRHNSPSDVARDPFEDLPISVYDRDRATIRDAWGSPLVFMPGQHPQIGLAPSKAGQDQCFFFSAGPDRKYLTRDDNLYSYEVTRGGRE